MVAIKESLQEMTVVFFICLKNKILVSWQIGQIFVWGSLDVMMTS